MMKPPKILVAVLQFGVLAFLVAATPLMRASTIWNGPSIGIYHTQENGVQDQMTPGVSITRGTNNGGLYNSVTESSAVAGISPQDTEWAIGTLADTNTLTFGPCILEAGHSPPAFVGTNFVVHLIKEDIYLQLTLTNWGGSGDKTFGYARTTPAVTVNLSGASIQNGQFSFNYSVVPGLSYVIEVSSNLTVWTPLQTNIAATNPAPFSATYNSNVTGLFYRAGRLPNP
jgi:hypothetical protein